MAAVGRLALPWPLPALLAWGAGWLLFALLWRAGAAPWLALSLSMLPGVAASMAVRPWWRRAMLALGFPLSVWAVGGVAGVGWPGWVWLLPVALVWSVYPLRAWRDAPVFPTPARALDGLPSVAPLPEGARVLDAGCGLGDGLRALRRAYPHAKWDGWEWSWPLWAACALRCSWARVRRGDLWQATWGDYALVYLFQRPESMGRAWAKATREMAPGSWLVSLEFEVPGQACVARLDSAAGRSAWVYRLPGAAADAPAGR